MGIASAVFSFSIRSVETRAMPAALWDVMTHSFLKPKSMELRVPGQEAFKFPGAVDGTACWGRDPLPNVLPGEVFDEQSQFSSLTHGDMLLATPEARQIVMSKIGQFRDRAFRNCENQLTRDDEVFWTFWGTSKVFFRAKSGDLSDGWFLRQKLIFNGQLEPICRVTSSLFTKPEEEFVLRIWTHSHVWSEFESRVDPITREWIPKSSLSAERLNAKLLAQTISSFLGRFPDAQFEWDAEKEHMPDLRGVAPAELEAQLGHPRTLHDVRSVMQNQARP